MSTSTSCSPFSPDWRLLTMHFDAGRLKEHGRIHKPLRVPRWELVDLANVAGAMDGRALRSAMSSPCASTTRKPCTPGLRTWRLSGTQAVALVEKPSARVWRLYMAGRPKRLRRRRKLRCTRSSGPPAQGGASGCHGPGLGGAEKWKTTREPLVASNVCSASESASRIELWPRLVLVDTSLPRKWNRAVPGCSSLTIFVLVGCTE